MLNKAIKKIAVLDIYDIEKKNEEILDSISYAKRIQTAILPSFRQIQRVIPKSFILYKPKDIVSGDFYWLELSGNSILFAACDCTGHGVPGAMVSVICNGGLNRAIREFGLTDTGQILDKTRELVIQEFEKSEEEVKDGMDIALCKLEGNTLSYSGANNPLWIIPFGSKDIESIVEYKADKQPIGKYSDEKPFTTHTIELKKGDSVYIFSDGFVDQFGGEKGKKFKAKAFRSLLISAQEKSMENQKQVLDEAFENWRGELEQIDDVCVIGIRI
jgi:serine phosphatase RsbU (regulator of sigma subunit)